MTTIRQMCETYNVTPRTLRFYEQRGLLSPIRHGNRREFTDACKKRVELILRLKGFGFSLDDVEAVLNGASHERIQEIADQAMDVLTAEYSRVLGAIHALNDALVPEDGMKAFELEGV